MTLSRNVVPSWGTSATVAGRFGSQHDFGPRSVMVTPALTTPDSPLRTPTSSSEVTRHQVIPASVVADPDRLGDGDAMTEAASEPLRVRVTGSVGKPAPAQLEPMDPATANDPMSWTTRGSLGQWTII